MQPRDDRQTQGEAKSDRSPEGQRQRRQRPRRGKSPGRGKNKGDRNKDEKGAPKAPAPLTAPRELDRSKSVDAPLTQAEMAEMQEHFRFLHKHRRHLRLKPNAAEDLLLNGGREPAHRGVCLHLLAKVDRAAVDSALARITDPGARCRLLEGIVRFSDDVGIVLLYLELLVGTVSRTDAVVALNAGLRRIDFSNASPAQMRRLLDLMLEVFGPKELPLLLLGLLQSSSFQGAFDDSLEALPGPLADLFVPLRAAHAAIYQGGGGGFGVSTLSRGVAMLLAAPAAAHKGHSERVRRRLLELGMEYGGDDAGPALDALLSTFPKDQRSFSALALEHARRLLKRDEEKRARRLLEDIRKHHPGFRLPGQWLERLEGPRVGRLALRPKRSESDRSDQGSESAGGQSADTGDGSLQEAFCIRDQRQLWARVGTREDSHRMRAEAEIQSSLAVPSIAPLALCSFDAAHVPYIAVPMLGHRADLAVCGERVSLRTSLAWALEGVLICGACARSGVQLPTLALEHFLLGKDGRLWLASLAGATVAPVDEAVAANQAVAAEWCRARLSGHKLPAALPADLGGGLDFPELALRLIL